jgi:hypothetical protein
VYVWEGLLFLCFCLCFSACLFGVSCFLGVVFFFFVAFLAMGMTAVLVAAAAMSVASHISKR